MEQFCLFMMFISSCMMASPYIYKKAFSYYRMQGRIKRRLLAESRKPVFPIIL